MTSNTMVFGDDDTSSSDVAWLWIMSQRWPGWRVQAVTAVLPEVVIAQTAPSPMHEWHPVHPRSPFAESGIEEVQHLICDRDPRVALMQQADLLVVGPRGPGVVKAVHLGSTLEWLLSRPPAPLVLARRGCTMRTATICHDGSVHAKAATDALCSLPWAPSLSVSVVTIDDGDIDVDGVWASASERLLRAGITPCRHIVRGGTTKELLRHLGESKTDLTVMGTRGLSGVDRLRLGSVARSVAHATTASMMLACDLTAQHEGRDPT